MTIILTVVCLLIMAAGLAGTILPALPGLPLIYLGYLIFGLFTSWQSYGLWTMLLWGAVVAFTLVIDYYAGVLGARRWGSSIFGMWGSLAGAIIGLLLFGLPGLVLGTFGGAVGGELVAGRSIGEALKAGKGSLIGLLAGTLFRAAIGLVMIGTFIWLIWARP
jgi:uncharacterized protein YqgC (DUF456 family)